MYQRQKNNLLRRQKWKTNKWKMSDTETKTKKSLKERNNFKKR